MRAQHHRSNHGRIRDADVRRPLPVSISPIGWCGAGWRLAQTWVIATLLGLLIVASSALPTRAQAEDAPSAEPDLGFARKQWREQVQATKRRVQQEAAQRRLEAAYSRVEPSQEDMARSASEEVVNDDVSCPGILS